MTSVREVLKCLSKNQYSDQPQREQTERWTNKRSSCNLRKARENLRVQGAIGFGFAYRWLKNWREIFKSAKQPQSRNYFQQSFENCSNTVNDFES